MSRRRACCCPSPSSWMVSSYLPMSEAHGVTELLAHALHTSRYSVHSCWAYPAFFSPGIRIAHIHREAGLRAKMTDAHLSLALERSRLWSGDSIFGWQIKVEEGGNRDKCCIGLRHVEKPNEAKVFSCCVFRVPEKRQWNVFIMNKNIIALVPDNHS